MAMNQEVAALIERVVRDRFIDDAIEAVRVKEATDSDGERVYYVTVIYGKKGMLDPHKKTGIVRHIRHRLLEGGDNTFPIFTYMSKADAELKTEAA